MRKSSRVASTVGLALVALLLSGCPLPSELRNQLQSNVGPATIGSAYTGTVPTSGAGWTLSAIAPSAPWLTGTVATGDISGTPDGNDFGTWPVTLTYTKGGSSKTATVNVVVGNPVLTFDPPGGFDVPYLSQADVDVTLSPAPATAYNYTYTWALTSNGQTRLALSGPTTSTGTEKVTLAWQAGADFTANVTIHLVSNAPGGARLNLGPIPAKSN